MLSWGLGVDSTVILLRWLHAPDTRDFDLADLVVLHDWTLAQVRERIATAGTRSREAYAAGMSRLSCRFCVLSSRADLVCSARLNPDLADRYAEVERRIGHRFRTDLTMADVIAEAHDAGQLALIPLADIA